MKRNLYNSVDAIFITFPTEQSKIECYEYIYPG